METYNDYVQDADDAVDAGTRQDGHKTRPMLTFVIPTRNELVGMKELLHRLSLIVDGPSEVVFVDDSDDATPYGVRRLAEGNTYGDLDIRLIHRTLKQREGGLGSAVCEGIRRARGEWLCVLDADLQHPPEMIPELLATAIREKLDVVIGSRYVDGGQDNALSTGRRMVSRTCAMAAKTLFPIRLRNVTDPLSGFFLLRREAINTDELHPHGFKILLEILGRNPKLTAGEVGFDFTERYAGVSKASVREGARYFWQLGHLRTASLNFKKEGEKFFLYDIHRIITVQSCVRLPELEKFRVRYLNDPPSIRIDLKRFDRHDPGELIELTEATARIRFNETFGNAGFSVEVELGDSTQIWASPFITRSPHVLYTNVVEPILRWQFVERNYALMHCACFTDGNVAHLVTARTDTGKTTTMLKILELGNYGFLSDDLILINKEGNLLTYPKPLTISNHTVHALQSAELGRMESLTLPLQSRLHSKGGREFALYLASKNIPVATLNAFVQRMIPPPKYHIERLVPGAPTGQMGKVGTLNIIERGEDHNIALEAAAALEMLFANCEDAYGFPPYTQLAALIHSCADGDLAQREHDIITAGLSGVQTKLYSSSSMGWAESIHQDVAFARAQKLNGHRPEEAKIA